MSGEVIEGDKSRGARIVRFRLREESLQNSLAPIKASSHFRRKLMGSVLGSNRLPYHFLGQGFYTSNVGSRYYWLPAHITDFDFGG